MRKVEIKIKGITVYKDFRRGINSYISIKQNGKYIKLDGLWLRENGVTYKTVMDKVQLKEGIIIDVWLVREDNGKRNIGKVELKVQRGHKTILTISKECKIQITNVRINDAMIDDTDMFGATTTYRQKTTQT